MRIRFLDPASEELDQAVDWFESQVSGLGVEFLDEIDRAIRRIAAWPFSCEEILPNIRRCLISRFPYGVIYRIDEKTVVILAIAHLHRKPRYWIKRSDNQNTG
jgi:plasmid stabilization system protein ParE